MPTETGGQWSDVDNRIRAYIVNTIRPLVPMGDAMGGMLFGVLNRMLRQATHEDLLAIVSQTGDFIDGLRAEIGYIDVASEATTYLAALPGPSALDRGDTAGEIDAGEVPAAELPSAADAGSEDEEDVAATTGAGDRHEATVASDAHDSGQVDEPAVSEDGAG